MLIHKPDYYDDFVCIAGECPFTCCQEWKIGVDETTKEKWANMIAPSDTQIRHFSMKNIKMDEVVVDSDGESTIALCEDGYCPFFNEKGLCDIVLTYGEENISKTCHTYPREYHRFNDFEELTLAMGCPAALRLLWKSEDFKYVNKVVETKSGDDNTIEDTELLSLRDFIIDKFSEDKSIESSIKMLFYIVLDCFEHDDTSVEYFDEGLINEVYSKIDELEDSYEDSVNEHNELFLDIADNYRKKKIYADILEPLAELAIRYEDADSGVLVSERKEFDAFVHSKKIYEDKTIYKLLRLLVKEEIYSTLLLPESDLYSMVMKLQWIAINYVVIFQALFLSRKLKGDISYEDVEKIVAVIIRMTGYSDEDIEEYLEASFQEIIWEWGYMALLMGEDK